jgi:hypothetical protein
MHAYNVDEIDTWRTVLPDEEIKKMQQTPKLEIVDMEGAYSLLQLALK